MTPVERVANDLARAKQRTDDKDGRAWARRIMQRHARGDRLPAISLDYAREALGLPKEPA